MPNETMMSCARGLFPAASSLIAIIALGFTASQFWLSRKTAQRQLRAYVGLKSGGIGLAKDTHGRWIVTASVVFENFGNTPAYDFTTYAQIVGVFLPDDDPYDRAAAIPISGRASSILFPGKTVNSSARAFITDNDVDGLVSGRMKIFFRGGADFTDTFGKKRHFKYYDKNGDPHDSSHWSSQPHSRGYKAD